MAPVAERTTRGETSPTKKALAAKKVGKSLESTSALKASTKGLEERVESEMEEEEVDDAMMRLCDDAG